MVVAISLCIALCVSLNTGNLTGIASIIWLSLLGKPILSDYNTINKGGNNMDKRYIKTGALTGKQLRHPSHLRRKIVTGALIATMFTSTTAFAMSDTEVKMIYASNTNTQSNVTEFTDLTGYDWAKSAIETLASKGIVVGKGENKYAPADNVTRTEFVVMAVRSYNGDLGKLAEQAGNLNNVKSLNGEYWGNSAISAARVFGLTDRFGDSKEDWNEPATRGEMAYICMTIAEKLGGEEFSIKDGIENNIGDYNIVSASGFKNNILKAYSNGILVGINDRGDYGTMNNANRAEAAVIIQHLIDPSTRTTVEVKAPEVVVPPVVEGDNVGQYATYPKEGDVINGVTVTRDAKTGVLGFGNGQKGGIYLGIEEIYADGTKHPIKVGSTSSNNYDNMNSGDTYVEKHGMTFWSSEWSIIENTARKQLPDPTKSSVGLKADIYGNIIKSGDTSTPAFELQEVFEGYCQWVFIY